ncbi:unnamed protein product [Darwinula stevensoni]|uniref:Carboxylesterase type B domain-containing protein n=1 Tax=Darwinula stevensoni TaxID=69355 RepID=A0A7R8X8L1_9CRUS|nr:unnamed protein product [Darwinula stevensoni]CAG0884578.1 unnamed protein product [Darwinula stevensoni]
MSLPILPDFVLPVELLFQRVILMSGTAYSPQSLVQDPRDSALQMAIALNCTSSAKAKVKIKDEELMTCLKEKPWRLLLDIPVKCPHFTSAFGPSVDNVLIKRNLDDAPEKQFQNAEPYDVMLGLTGFEPAYLLNEHQLQLGFDLAHLDKIFRTVVRNFYRFHLREILSAVEYEYTDWSRAVDSPLGNRDAAIEALGDAMFAAPASIFAQEMVEEKAAVFLYHFAYRAPSDDPPYPRGLGRLGWEDLQMLLGAPFTGTFIGMPFNYSKNDAFISRLFMTHVVNFVSSGDPNRPHNISSSPDKSVMQWPAMDTLLQRYLEIDPRGRVRVRSHYRAHRLALWTHLIPEIQGTGSRHGDIQPHHHLLQGHQDTTSYVGQVRELPEEWGESDATQSEKESTSVGTTVSPELFTPEIIRVLQDSQRPWNESLRPSSYDLDYSTYSTALTVTIAIGSSLLILNVLIFAGVYYRRGRRNHSNRSQYSEAPTCPRHGSSETFFEEFQGQSSINTQLVEVGCPVRIVEKRTRFADEDPPNGQATFVSDVSL